MVYTLGTPRNPLAFDEMTVSTDTTDIHWSKPMPKDVVTLKVRLPQVDADRLLAMKKRIRFSQVSKGTRFIAWVDIKDVAPQGDGTAVLTFTTRRLGRQPGMYVIYPDPLHGRSDTGYDWYKWQRRAIERRTPRRASRRRHRKAMKARGR